MTQPRLAQWWSAKSNDGRSYKYPWAEEYPQYCDEKGNYHAYSVTTCLGTLDKPGLPQWMADQVAAYAVTHPESVLERSEAKGYNFLRWAGRKVTARAADTGDHVHTYAESLLNWAVDTPTPSSRDEEQEFRQMDLLFAEHDIEPIYAETTVWAHPNERHRFPYAGTLDAIMVLDGKVTVCDHKTSHFVHEGHLAQICSIANADELLRWDGDPNDEHKYQWEDMKNFHTRLPMPEVEQYAIFNVRPDFVESSGEFTPAHHKVYKFDREELEQAGYLDLFYASLEVKHANESLRQHFKGVRESSKSFD